MKQEFERVLQTRIKVISGIFVLIFVILSGKAFYLHFFSDDRLKCRAEQQHKKSLAVHTERGMILDRNGEKMAASIMTDSVYADPSMIEDADKTTSILAPVLGIHGRALLKKISRKGRFCWVARMISPEQAGKIRDLNLKGVYLIPEPKRFYTNKELACHLIGFVDIDSKGREGLERQYESYLQGAFQNIMLARDGKGKSLYLDEVSLKREEDDAGCNLILTIDGRIQHIVELQLRETLKSTGARAGIVIVMDPNTGEILALANEPDFNPNVFYKYRAASRRNRAITDCFDPGSVFKPFLVAAALEEGSISSGDSFFCENGSYLIGGRVIHEAQRKKYKELTVREILKYSSNIGSVKIVETLGKEKFYSYIKKFGFGMKTGVDLPGEALGILRHPSQWRTIDSATIAFGQGISVTPIQLITAMSAIANRGVLMKPYVARGIVNKKGQVICEMKPTVVRRVVSPFTAEKVVSMLNGVVEDEDGTGKNARLVHVAVAGKTGTSQKYDAEIGQYSSQKIVASFIGFFPVETPRIVVLVMLDEPKVQRWGGQAAAPVFQNISEQIVQCFNRDIDVDDFEGYEEGEHKYLNVLASETLAPRSEFDGIHVPDFTGMTIREVVGLARSGGFEVKVQGSGWAVDQDPHPGIPLRHQRVCNVIFRTY